MNGESEHTLEYLLGFDGRIHHYAKGYFAKFEIKRVEPAKERPHGLRYSFTLHREDGTRVLGFDNAHAIPATRSGYKKRPEVADHWHRTANDPGRAYEFISAGKLIEDYFNEVERILAESGVPLEVTSDEDRSAS